MHFQITQAMIEYFVKHHQTEEMYLKKVKLRDALYNILNGVLTRKFGRGGVCWKHVLMQQLVQVGF